MSWPMVSLGDVAEITMGQAPKGDTYNDKAEGLPLIAGAGDFPNGKLKIKKFTDSPTKVCEIGDIILGIRATIGVKVVSDGLYCLGRGVAGVRPSSALDSRFLWHGLTHTNSDLVRKARGATFVQVSLKDIADLTFPLPPLDEQRRLARILDAADALRSLRRDALALLDTLPSAIFAEMFGDIANLPSVPFGHVIHDIGNGVSPSRAGTVEDEVLTLSAVTGASFNASKRKTDKFAGEIPVGKRVEMGDFLLCRGNGNPALVGSGKLADDTGQGFVYPDTIMRAKLNYDRVIPGYIASLWKHNHIRDQITAGARTTNGTMKINQTTVKSIEIPLPDLASQAEFARRASGIESGIKAQQVAQLLELETLFASLQSRAFAGAL